MRIIYAQGQITSSTPTFYSDTILHHQQTWGVSPECRVFNELGPTPQLCIDYLRSGDMIERYRQDVQEAISNLTTSELQRLLRDARSLTMDAVSHKICLITRKDREDMYSRAIVSPITPYIKSRLANHFRTLERGEQIYLYKYFSKVPGSTAMAGVFFEAAAQGCFQDGITLELLPMVRLPTQSHIGMPTTTEARDVGATPLLRGA